MKDVLNIKQIVDTDTLPKAFFYLNGKKIPFGLRSHEALDLVLDRLVELEIIDMKQTESIKKRSSTFCINKKMVSSKEKTITQYAIENFSLKARIKRLITRMGR